MCGWVLFYSRSLFSIEYISCNRTVFKLQYAVNKRLCYSLSRALPHVLEKPKINNLILDLIISKSGIIVLSHREPASTEIFVISCEIFK